MHPVDIVSPLPISSWYQCRSKDFIQHLKTDYLYASFPEGKGKGLTDMNALVLTNVSVPFGAGYTRHYAMRVAALFLGLDLGLMHKRYDLFGLKWASARYGRVSISPIAPRAGGDPDQKHSWNYRFPTFASCDHSNYHIINWEDGGELARKTVPQKIWLDRDRQDEI